MPSPLLLVLLFSPVPEPAPTPNTGGGGGAGFYWPPPTRTDQKIRYGDPCEVKPESDIAGIPPTEEATIAAEVESTLCRAGITEDSDREEFSLLMRYLRVQVRRDRRGALIVRPAKPGGPWVPLTEWLKSAEARHAAEETVVEADGELVEPSGAVAAAAPVPAEAPTAVEAPVVITVRTVTWGQLLAATVIVVGVTLVVKPEAPYEHYDPPPEPPAPPPELPKKRRRKR